MSHHITRREFMKTIAAVSSGLSFSALKAFGQPQGAHAGSVTWNPAQKPGSALLEGAKDSLAHLDPMMVRVGKDRIALESGPRFRIADCRSVLYWRPSGRSAWVASPSSTAAMSA